MKVFFFCWGSNFYFSFRPFEHTLICEITAYQHLGYFFQILLYLVNFEGKVHRKNFFYCMNTKFSITRTQAGRIFTTQAIKLYWSPLSHSLSFWVNFCEWNARKMTKFVWACGNFLSQLTIQHFILILFYRINYLRVTF